MTVSLTVITQGESLQRNQAQCVVPQLTAVIVEVCMEHGGLHSM